MNIRLLGAMLGKVQPVIDFVYNGEHRKVRVEAVGINNKTKVPYFTGFDYNRNAYRTFSENALNHIEHVELA
jgi:hypothetical protein